MSLPDLNQLQTFIALYETRSATGAADTLHVSQPTVSYTLRALRRHFDDELFRREGNSFVPTPKATRLYEPLREALAHLDEILTDHTEFDPATFQGEVTLALSTMGIVTFLPKIAAATRREAPGVRIRVLLHVAASAEDALLRGSMDLALSVRMLPQERLWRTPVMPVEYVAATSQKYPLPPTSEQMFEGRQFIEVGSQGGHIYPNDALAEHGLAGQTALSIPGYSSLPLVLQESDLVALLPLRLAKILQEYRYAITYQPLPWPVHSPPVAVYSRRKEALSPVQRWFREMVQRSITEG